MESGGRSRWSLTVVALGALLAGGCQRGASERADPIPALGGLVASCAWTEGAVEVRRSGSIYWERVAIGTLFRSGDWVRTTAASRARLEFFVGGGLEVDPATLVVIELTPRDDGETEPLVEVESGAVRGRLASGAQGAQSDMGLSLRTAEGTQVRISSSGKPGTSDVVTVSAEAGVTQVALADGEPELQHAGGKRRALVAGQMLELVAGAARSRALGLGLPECLAPAVDARVALAANEQLALRWVPVSGAKGYRVQVARDFSFRQLERDERLETTSFQFVCQGERAWRVAAYDAQGRAGEFGFARRVYCDPRK